MCVARAPTAIAELAMILSIACLRMTWAISCPRIKAISSLFQSHNSSSDLVTKINPPGRAKALGLESLITLKLNVRSLLATQAARWRPTSFNICPACGSISSSNRFPISCARSRPTSFSALMGLLPKVVLEQFFKPLVVFDIYPE